MMQSLHILRKDIRHLWADLSLYVALLIASSVMIPMTWDGGATANIPLHIFAGLLKIMIPILWLVIIARLIHDESLVGDAQFWITRPYKWTSLLGAKLLFILLCVALPFSLCQWSIVLQAGFNPLHTIPAQALNLLQMGLIVGLTFTVVASVTSTVQRMFMSMLAVVVLWALALTFLTVPAGPRMALPLAPEIFGIVIGGLLVAILLYQYASRNTFRSRIALVATALLFVALFSILVEGRLQPLVNVFVRHHYPVSTDASLKLVFDPAAKPSKSPQTPDNRVGKLEMIILPVSIQGLDPHAQLDDHNVSFTIDGPSYHYVSPWRPAYTEDGIEEGNLILFIPPQVLNNIRGSNVHMHFSEVAQRLQPGTPQTVTAATDFNVPENGRCHLEANLPGNNVTCRYSFEIASRTIIRAAVADGSCGGPTRPGITMLAALPPLGGPDPTIERTLHMGGAVCPGAQMTFTHYHPAENFRLELDIPSISLDQYVTR
jgi:hypothetical protein